MRQASAEQVESIYRHLAKWQEHDHEKAVVWAHGFIGELHDIVAGQPYTPHLLALVDRLKAEPCPPWGSIDRAIMETRHLPQSDEMEEIDILEADEGFKPPAWSSSVDALDEKHGGFYGLTTIAGDTGLGKSTLAIASAVRAAMDGWGVVIFEAELDGPTLTKYVARACRSLHADRSRLEIRCASITEKSTFDGLADFVLQSVHWWRKRTLVVLDSVNAAVQFMGSSRRGYFETLDAIAHLFGSLRRRTRGLCSSVLVSEMTRGGEVKGQKLEYLSDMLVYVKRGDLDDTVNISVTKGRYSGVSDHEDLVRDWRSGLFLSRGHESMIVPYGDAALLERDPWDRE